MYQTYCLQSRASTMHLTALGLLQLQITPAIKSKMQREGDALINFQPLGSLPNFFRIVFASPLSIVQADLDGLLKRMDQYGQELWQTLQNGHFQSKR